MRKPGKWNFLLVILLGDEVGTGPLWKLGRYLYNIISSSRNPELTLVVLALPRWRNSCNPFNQILKSSEDSANTSRTLLGRRRGEGEKGGGKGGGGRRERRKMRRRQERTGGKGRGRGGGKEGREGDGEEGREEGGGGIQSIG